MMNPLGSKGNIVQAFSGILHELWHGEMPYITPFHFRVCILVSFSIGGGADLLGFLMMSALYLSACITVWRVGAA